MFSAEFQAVFTCLSCLSHRSFPSPPPKFLLLTDSLSSLLTIQDTYSDNPIAQSIHVFLNSVTASSITVSFRRILGHIGLPKHDAVDIAAKESLLSPTITDSSITPAYDLKTYYRSLIYLSGTNPGTYNLQTNSRK